MVDKLSIYAGLGAISLISLLLSVMSISKPELQIATTSTQSELVAAQPSAPRVEKQKPERKYGIFNRKENNNVRR